MPLTALDTFGPRLSEAITACEISQHQFALCLDVSPGFVSDMVRGLKKPGSEFLFKLNQTLGVSINWLLTGAGNMFGDAPINLELFKTIALQIEIARAAKLSGNPIALALIEEIQGKRLPGSVSRTPEGEARINDWSALIDDACQAATIFNAHLQVKSRRKRVQDSLASALAYIETHKPVDIAASLVPDDEDDSEPDTSANTSKQRSKKTIMQVVRGKSVQNAGRDFVKTKKGKR